MKKLYHVAYMNCFGQPDLIFCGSRTNALSIVEYLRAHPVAFPLYLIGVKHNV